jgi:hypothetical protein
VLFPFFPLGIASGHKFKRSEPGQKTCWEGSIDDQKLTGHNAELPKAQKSRFQNFHYTLSGSSRSNVHIVVTEICL